MADNIYWRIRNEPGESEIGPTLGMGQGANDAWQIVARFPNAEMPQGASKRLSLWASGVIGEVSYQGPQLPQKGLIQICLGTVGGLRSTVHRQSIPIRESQQDVSNVGDGVQWSFLMIQQALVGSAPAISDSTFGPSFNTAAGIELCVWARVAYNGDSPQYLARAVAANIQFVLFDMDEMQANEHCRGLVTEVADTTMESHLPGQPLPYSPPSIIPTFTMQKDANPIGTDGDNWIHFGAVVYKTKTVSNEAPLFTFGLGSGTTSFSANQQRVRVGLNRSGQYPGNEEWQTSQGCIFHDVITAPNNFVTVEGVDQQVFASVLFKTTYSRAATLSIKLDEMQDSNFFGGNRFQEGEAQTSLSPDPALAFVPLERPENLLLTDTTLFFCANWGGTGPGGLTVPVREAALLSITTPQALPIFAPAFWTWIDGVKKEFVQLHTITDVVEPPQPAKSWQARVLVKSNDVTARNVIDPQLCSGYKLFDPSNTPTSAWVEPNPVILQIGREAAGVIPTLPIVPDATSVTSMEGFKFGSVTGRTGYKRTWPTWVRTRRTFQLKYEPITDPDAVILESWLVLNPVFSFTPQGEGIAIDCIISGAIESERLGDGRSILRINAVELIWIV
tara:strand:+ start:10982 stop:12835 length:1854 start_codon:yes stop_codon:yes gene_type:complete